MKEDLEALDLEPEAAKSRRESVRQNYLQLWDMLKSSGRDRRVDHASGHAYSVWTRLESRSVKNGFNYTDVNWGPWQLLSQVLAPTFCKEGLNIDFGEELDQLIGSLGELAKNVHAYLLFENIAFLSEFPLEMHIDNEGRYHSETGPGIRYSDGFGLHAWHGTIVPPAVILEPPTVQAIENEDNVEVRRVLVNKYGEARYLIDSGAQPIDESEFGTLYRIDVAGDEALTMIKVTNRTAEPDGSYRTYFLRVPPSVHTAREGVAWTFDMDEKAYRPRIES